MKPTFFGTVAGGSSFVPSDVAGLELWLEADTLTLNNNDPVATWTDQSGNENDATASGVARPTYKTNTINGLPSLEFNGTSNFLNIGASGAFAALTALETFLVMKVPTFPPVASNGLWSMGGGSNAYVPYETDGSIYDDFGSSTRQTCGVAVSSMGVWCIYGVWSVSADWENQINGVQQYHTGTNTVFLPAQNILGKNLIGNFHLGNVAAFLLYDHKLTTPDRTLVLGYLQTKYAI